MIISLGEIKKFIKVLKIKQMFDNINKINFINKINLKKMLIFLLKYFIINLEKDLYKIIKKIYNSKSRKDVQNG